MNEINLSVFATIIRGSPSYVHGFGDSSFGMFVGILIPILGVGCLSALWFGTRPTTSLQIVRHSQRFCGITSGFLFTTILASAVFKLRDFASDKLTIEFSSEMDLMWWQEWSELFHLAGWAIPVCGFGIAASWLLGQVARDKRERGG